MAAKTTKRRQRLTVVFSNQAGGGHCLSHNMPGGENVALMDDVMSKVVFVEKIYDRIRVIGPELCPDD